MTPTETTRLTHLLAMTASPHDGEALNAIRLAYKYMRENSLNWQDIVEGKAMPHATRTTREAYEKGYAEGYAKGTIAGERAPRARSASWRHLIEDILASHEDQLTDWEREFLINFLYRKWHTPTDRQHTVLERIANKLGVDLPDQEAA